MRGNWCSQCGKDGLLMKCSNCKVAFYCGRECQTKQHSSHKNSCRKVKYRLDAVEKAEKCVRAQFNTLGIDIFTEETGNFWSIPDTRSYMVCRHNHFLTLIHVGTPFSLREALVQGKEMLRLCRNDNLGTRELMVPVFLRLNTYQSMQDCYNFIRTWDTDEFKGSSKSIQSVSQLEEANMLEAPYSALLHKHETLYFSVGATVIKMRLLLQLNTFLFELNALLLSTMAPMSFMGLFRGNHGVLITVSTFLRPAYHCFVDKTVAQLRSLQISLQQHVYTMLEVVETHHNRRIWKALVSPAQILRAPCPASLSKGSAEETIVVATSFLECFHANTIEARGILQMLVRRVGANPEYDLARMKF